MEKMFAVRSVETGLWLSLDIDGEWYFFEHVCKAFMFTSQERAVFILKDYGITGEYNIYGFISDTIYNTTV